MLASDRTHHAPPTLVLNDEYNLVSSVIFRYYLRISITIENYSKLLPSAFVQYYYPRNNKGNNDSTVIVVYIILTKFIPKLMFYANP